jgi:hypothetical protein
MRSPFCFLEHDRKQPDESAANSPALEPPGSSGKVAPCTLLDFNAFTARSLTQNRKNSQSTFSSYLIG